MFLGAYHFEGDTTTLLAGYERLLADYPPAALDLHVCVVRDRGITVFDACPSREAFEQFSQSQEFRMSVASTGLPPARVELLGEVRNAHIREAATR